MASDPIRDAVAAAGEAVRKALVKPPCCMEGTGCEMPPCHCSVVAARAAIAAFLRSAQRAEHWPGFSSLDAIAAAVEAEGME